MRAYERLLKYVAFDTTSDEDSPSCPSTPNQLLLAQALADELRGLGVADARVDAYGYVYGSLPATAAVRRWALSPIWTQARRRPGPISGRALHRAMTAGSLCSTKH